MVPPLLGFVCVKGEARSVRLKDGGVLGRAMMGGGGWRGVVNR